MTRNSLTNRAHIKIMSRKGGVRSALRALRTPPLRTRDNSSACLRSFRTLILRKIKIEVNLNGILYQNYTADLYQFKTAVDT